MRKMPFFVAPVKNISKKSETNLNSTIDLTITGNIVKNLVAENFVDNETDSVSKLGIDKTKSFENNLNLSRDETDIQKTMQKSLLEKSQSTLIESSIRIIEPKPPGSSKKFSFSIEEILNPTIKENEKFKSYHENHSIPNKKKKITCEPTNQIIDKEAITTKTVSDADSLTKKLSQGLSQNSTFANSQNSTLDNSQNLNSQRSNYSSLLQKVWSEAPAGLSHKERLYWLQERRQVGMWVECCNSDCKKWRYLADIHDPLEIPNLWYCHMNSDAFQNSCDKKIIKLTVLEIEDFICNQYNAGSVVWARMTGYPWWPAIVDDCPDCEMYYWLNEFSSVPTYYNVTFLDYPKVTRSWISIENIKPYAICGTKVPFKVHKVPANLRRRLDISKRFADDAIMLDVQARLRKYSFIARFKGPINSPKAGKLDKNNKISEVFTNFDTDNESENSTNPESDANKWEEHHDYSSKIQNVLMGSDVEISDIQYSTGTIKRNIYSGSNIVSYDNKKKNCHIETIRVNKSEKKNMKAVTVLEHNRPYKITTALIRRESMSIDSDVDDPVISVPQMSEEIIIQSPIIFTKVSARLGKETVSQSSLNLEELERNEGTDSQTTNITDNSEFDKITTSDAVVPSTEKNINDLEFNFSQNLSEETLDIDS